MNLLVISHKECWSDSESPTGYSTIGGFPFQMKAISELFDQTVLVLPVYKAGPPDGAIPLIGCNLRICPLDMPLGSNLSRKLWLPVWSVRNIPRILRTIAGADAVHTPVPGDIGTIGILLALLRRKPLFIRHCGTWGNRATLANRFLMWLLPKIAGNRNVVMATGGNDGLPCPENPEISWIFSTTISREEWKSIPKHEPWKRGKVLKLVTVSRLDPDKNTESIIKALPVVKKVYPNTILNVVGDGPFLKNLKRLTSELEKEDSVIFHGRVPHERVLEIMADSHLFVFPTRVKEGCPKVVPEAFACGLPVIATRVSIIPYLIGDKGGIVLDKTDPDSVAKAIIELISDEKRLAQMSSNAREMSQDMTIERWRELIGERLQARWGPLRRANKQN